MTKEKALKELVAIEEQIKTLSESAQKLRQIVAKSDKEGYGVMVSKDYDYGWIVEVLEGGEWEVDNTEAFIGEKMTFTGAVSMGEELAGERQVKLRVFV